MYNRRIPHNSATIFHRHAGNNKCPMAIPSSVLSPFLRAFTSPEDGAQSRNQHRSQERYDFYASVFEGCVFVLLTSKAILRIRLGGFLAAGVFALAAGRGFVHMLSPWFMVRFPFVNNTIRLPSIVKEWVFRKRFRKSLSRTLAWLVPILSPNCRRWHQEIRRVRQSWGPT